jgi:EmrB/QacA subfamily drug resistance transporter
MTLILGCFMAILDASIVNVALPRLRAIFGADAGSVQWVATAYLLVSGMVIPITGYLCERFGNKRVYIAALLVFITGSGMCALAWSNHSLVFARVIQAVGGGMILPVSMSMIRIIVPRAKMGTAMGIWGISAMGAPAVGPTLGGLLVVHLGWQWVFAINLPIGLAAMFLAWNLLGETPRRTGLRLDLAGFVLIASACFTLLLALSKGQDKGWTSLFIINLIVYTFFALLLFVIWELTTAEPLIHLRLLKNRTYVISLASVCLSNIAMYSVIYLIPIYAQTVRGLTPLQSGLLTMPSALVTALMMPVSGRLFDRFGAMPLCLAGFGIAAYYSYQLHTLSYSTGFAHLQWILVKRSVGFGLAMMSMSTAGMKTIPRHLANRAATMNNLVRQVSGSFGIALITYAMLRGQVYHAAWLGDTVSWSSHASLNALNNLQHSLTRSGVSPALAAFGARAQMSMVLNREAFIAGIDDAVMIPVLATLMIIPLGLFLSKKAVEKESARQYARLAPPTLKGPDRARLD